MPRSEIDDIFASAEKGSVHPATSSPIPTPRKKKKKDKKRKRQTSNDDADHEEKPPKRPTILDPSSSLSKSKTEKTCSMVAVRSKAGRKQREDLEAFKDSRGSGPRRKTEEGFAIYKEAELGIDVEAGDTPLCPFDCDCCF